MCAWTRPGLRRKGRCERSYGRVRSCAHGLLLVIHVPYPSARVGAWLGAALSAVGVLGVIALAVTDHRHRAVMLMVAVLVGMGALRLWTPGRPWFASRARLMDVAVYVILAAIIWWFAPYVSTLAVR